MATFGICYGYHTDHNKINEIESIEMAVMLSLYFLMCEIEYV